MLGSLEENRIHREGIQRGIDPANRGKFIEEEEMNDRVAKMLSRSGPAIRRMVKNVRAIGQTHVIVAVMLSSKIPAFVAILCLFAPTTFGKQNASSVQPGIGLPPGIELPKTGMVYALAKKSSETTLIQIHASEVSSNLHTGSNLARSQFFMNLHATAELPGLKASLSIWTLSLCF